jgi:hypothetical protein
MSVIVPLLLHVPFLPRFEAAKMPLRPAISVVFSNPNIPNSFREPGDAALASLLPSAKLVSGLIFDNTAPSSQRYSRCHTRKGVCIYRSGTSSKPVTIPFC